MSVKKKVLDLKDSFMALSRVEKFAVATLVVTGLGGPAAAVHHARESNEYHIQKGEESLGGNRAAPVSPVVVDSAEVKAAACEALVNQEEGGIAREFKALQEEYPDRKSYIIVLSDGQKDGAHKCAVQANAGEQNFEVLAL